MTADLDLGLIARGAEDGAPWEQIPPDEANATTTIAALAEARVRAAAAKQMPALRDAHPKMHGCVEAQLHVLGALPPALAKGLFSTPAVYPAWVRFSNGSSTPQSDDKGDGRGMAIKVMGVAASRTGTQDFIMINSPAFFIRNAAEYVDFSKAANPFSFFTPDLNPFHIHLHDMLTALSIAGRRVSNPLNAQYFSMTPYLYGDTPCKFSARPFGPPSAFEDRSTPNFLRDNLVKALDTADAGFEFCIQLRNHPDALPIEDPSIEWREAVSAFVPVARLIIPRQGFATAERDEFGQNLSFTPWHGLDAHRPLGGINRVRRVVYETISRVRHQINGVAPAEPTGPTPLIAATPVAPPPKETSVAGNIFDGLISMVGAAIDDCGWLDKAASNLVVNRLVETGPNRPHPFSTASDYTSWKSLTDLTYQGRQLPPAPAPDTPAIVDVVALFKRSGAQKLSAKSTCLFPAFAQYLTDGFIRTGIPGLPESDANRTRTSSNHQIDLCQLYGRLPAHTDALRLMSKTPGRLGRLKSQMIGNEELPPPYFSAAGPVDPDFVGLDVPLWAPSGPPTDPPVRASVFAVGGDRVNSTPFTAMMNTLFLREHNRVAGQLESNNPTWDDEQVFQTARNIVIAIFIKIVVEQYINHITPLPFNLVADPSVAWTAAWNKPNWITAEFSLLYRWHSLMPDEIELPGGSIPLMDFGMNNTPLLNVSLADVFAAAATQPAAELGAFNTGDPLLMVEASAIRQARTNRLPTYNAYRQAYKQPIATQFSQISGDPRVQALLETLYGSPDKVEFYPGLFAADRVPKSPLPDLLMIMVGVDAFSQALTNPLLSEHVYNADTFTPWGLALIEDTHSLGQILQRAYPAVDPKTITMTQPSWNYWDVP